MTNLTPTQIHRLTEITGMLDRDAPSCEVKHEGNEGRFGFITLLIWEDHWMALADRGAEVGTGKYRVMARMALITRRGRVRWA